MRLALRIPTYLQNIFHLHLLPSNPRIRILRLRIHRLRIQIYAVSYFLFCKYDSVIMFEHVQNILGTSSILTCYLFVYIAYLFALAVHRLYLSPIAHFPGSKIAAISAWYETYWDVIKGGQFTFQIQRWHENMVCLCSSPYHHFSDILRSKGQ